MSPDIFTIKSGTEKDFIGNRKTGKWAIVTSLDDSVRSAICSQYENHRFTGVQMVVLNITRTCNFDCDYCFVRELKGPEKMNIETGEKAVDRVFELPEPNRRVVFHGNEPMTNFSLIKHLVQYAKEKGKIDFSIQSNGSLFNDEQIAYLTSEKVGIGISLDGMARHQNKTRPYTLGGGSFDDVVRNLQKIRDIQKGVSVISVVSKHNVNDLGEIVEFFEKVGVDSVCFNPAYPNNGADYCPDQEVLAKNMINLFDREIQRVISDKPGISINNLRDLLRTFFTPRTTYNCVRCSGTSIHPLIGIDIDGGIYPCDLFWSRRDFKMGNIFEAKLEESFNAANNFRVYRSIDNVKTCLDCDWKMFCGGECPGVSIRYNGAIASKGYYCDYRKTILEYAAGKIPLLHEKKVIGKVLNSLV